LKKIRNVLDFHQHGSYRDVEFTGAVYRERYVSLGNTLAERRLANYIWAQALDTFLAATLNK
jgi:hypothetical protein